jgi:hypothetical protein
MKKVVIPTDLTLFSLNLIKYALHLIKGEPCQIILVQLIPLSDSITELLTLPREAAAQAETTPFANALARLQKSYSIEVESIRLVSVYCDSSLHLKDFVRKNKVDLVLSTVPVTSAADDLCLFNKLAKDVSCPVLFIPEFFEINQFRKIAFVLNADEKTTVLPDQTLVNLLCRHDYHFTLVLVSKPGTTAHQLQHALDTVYSSPVLKGVVYSIHLIQEKDVTSGIVSFINEFEVDLVVACKKRSVLSYLRIDKSSRLRDTTIQAKVPCLSVA